MIKTHTVEQKTVGVKGQKIIAALLLVTGHLSETEPLRLTIRRLAMKLVEGASDDRSTICSSISALIESALIARIVSEHNGRILQAELKYFADSLNESDRSIATLFPLASTDKGHMSDKRVHDTNMSFISSTPQTNVLYKDNKNKEDKSKRQETILSYIATRKSANIKDIAVLFPQTSEKTIQRELSALVAGGRITKRGDKRWSIYLAIS